MAHATFRWLAVSAALASACGSEPGSAVGSVAASSMTPPPLPTPVIDLDAPWQLAHRDASTLAFRLGEGPDGVRVHLGGEAAGVTPIRNGRPLVTDGAPLVGVPWPDRGLSGVEIEVEGVDLVVRLSGPPLSEVSEHPDAPDDPVLTWVRLRPRGETWRIVTTGLGVLTLPDVGEVTPHRGGFRVQTGGWGRFDVDTEAPATDSALSGSTWTLTTAPSLDALQPYPRTGITWEPG